MTFGRVFLLQRVRVFPGREAFANNIAEHKRDKESERAIDPFIEEKVVAPENEINDVENKKNKRTKYFKYISIHHILIVPCNVEKMLALQFISC